MIPLVPQERENWMSESGARLLARRIERYWRSQGFPHVMAASQPASHIAGSYCVVRSNLRNGLPPRVPTPIHYGVIEE